MSILSLLTGKKAPTDANGRISADLSAAPIARTRMELLWLDPDALTLMASVAGRGDVAVFSAGDSGMGQPRPEDVTWAKEVNAIATQASQASQQNRFAAAIQYYRKALDLAPGCDLYLMSIGCCFANLGDLRTGLKYLQRAHQISPSNERIRRNYEGVRRAVLR